MTTVDPGASASADAGHAVVLFDGVCNLCSASVQFIIERDPDAYFRFASLQSAVGQRLVGSHGLAPGDLSSVLLVENGRIHTRSDAALRIARRLKGGWKGLTAFRAVPPFLRDGVYKWVAANRYRWFGKQEACWLPTPELRQRFLD